MSDFFAIPTTSVVLSNIGSWTNAFFLPFLGPTLFLVGIAIAIAIVAFMRKSFTRGVKKITRSR